MEDSASTAPNGDANLKICSFCKIETNLESGEAVYSCRTCSDKIETSTEKVWNCIGCISPCACQKHTIEDVNGYEVTICNKHRMINEYFCEKEECKCVLCSRCLLDHLNHNCVPAYKKSKDVRSEVFKYVSKLDSLSKDMKHRQQLQLDCRDSINEASTLCNSDEIAEVLLGFMRELIKKLIAQGTSATKCNQLIASFKAEHEKILEGNERTTVAKQIENSETLNTGLCQVLTKSDVVMVDNFTNMITSLGDSLKEQRLTLDSHVYCQPLYVRDENMRSHATSALSVFLNTMIWPTIKTLSYRPVNFNNSGYSAYLPADFKLNTTIALLNSSVFLVGLDKDDTWMIYISNNNRTQKFPASIANEKALTFRSCYGYGDQNQPNKQCFVVETHEGFYLARPLQNPNSDEMPIEQIFPDLVPNNLVVWYVTSACQVNCLVYDNDTNVVKPFQEDTAIRELKVTSKPTLFCLNHSRTIFAMTFGQSTDITVITNDSTETIPAVEHGFRTLNRLLLIYDYTTSACVLLAWDFSRQIFGVFRQNNCDFKWVLAAVFKCNFPGTDLEKDRILSVEPNYRNACGQNYESVYVTLDNFPNPFYVAFHSFANSTPGL
ncbi:uncharacterized protein LOC142342493 [Convolutriloba macropyga]|uniref:uncharacterized protein LOC142342493 n=1 Tax=Convolutriloba macropyga TaxID=536237 RepID=UPI003F525D7A